jgi:hypothetical protein
MATNNDTSILPLVETPSAEAKRASSWGRGVYGTNAYPGAASDLPGKRTRAPLSVNNDGGDAVLNAIKSGGAKSQDGNGQTRPYTSDQHVPTAHGMRNRRGE